MRFKTLFMSMFAAMAFVGCTSEDEPGSNNGGSGEPQFLTVNLVTNATNGSRAAGDQVDGDPSATYEEGLEAENKITKVRFYFFDGYGNAASVKANGDNYLDWSENISEVEPTPGNPTMPNVEKVLSATLVISTPDGDSTPDQIVAIINPTGNANAGDTNGDGKLSLAELEKIVGNYQADSYTTAGAFVMSNSTYAKNSAKVMAVSVKDKLHKSQGEALVDPVQIYVERTVAKVRLKSSVTDGTITLDNGTKLYKTSSSSKEQKYDGKDIYVKFLGWNTTAVASGSRLVKDINAGWDNALFGAGGAPWNWDAYRRSFWAINAENITHQYGAFKSNSDAENIFQAQKKTLFDGVEYIYVNENATDFANASTGIDPKIPTMVIIAAQLVDKDGEALEFAEYGAQRVTVAKLKEIFAESVGLYKATEFNEDGTVKKFVKITPADLTIKTAMEINAASKPVNGVDDNKGRYKVYIQLADGTSQWYTSNTAPAAAPISASEANTRLKNLGSAKIWRGGYTYYYFPINHFGSKIGVVRNHIYDANITELVGLGTPVYNPDEIIYPEKPVDDDNTFIAAQINILSWRLVKSDIKLEW